MDNRTLTLILSVAALVLCTLAFVLNIKLYLIRKELKRRLTYLGRNIGKQDMCNGMMLNIDDYEEAIRVRDGVGSKSD